MNYFACMLFYASAGEFCSFMPFILQLHPKNGSFMCFQTFPPWCLQFSSLVRRKHQAGFNFQLNFAVFNNGFAKIRVFYLQTDSCT